MKRLLSVFLTLLLILSLVSCSALSEAWEETKSGIIGDFNSAISEEFGSSDSSSEIASEPESSASQEAGTSEESGTSEKSEASEPSSEAPPVSSEAETYALPEEGGYYYDLENVVLHLELYGKLPDNFITKNQANSKGWLGGSVEKYCPGCAIGGDTFGNREGLLPKAKGRVYTECDLNTKGASSRRAERLVFSNDGLYFYTNDHYETFTEVFVTNDYKVVW